LHLKKNEIALASPRIVLSGGNVLLGGNKLSTSFEEAKITAEEVTVASPGASLELTEEATLQGAQVNLGGGEGEKEDAVGVSRLSTKEETKEFSFHYGVDAGFLQQWSDAATLTLVSEDRKDVKSFALSEGETSGTLRVFDFSGVRPGARYRAEIAEGGRSMPLFGLTELYSVGSDNTPDKRLGTPSVTPAAPRRFV
jgi:hypothetical protein